MSQNIFCKSKVIGMRFISSSVIKKTPVKLSYTFYGPDVQEEKPKKSPIVMMHGIFDSRSNFTSLAKSLNRLTGRTIITTGCRNHGDSPHVPELSYQEMTEDLKCLLEDLKINKSILMGHSMGGGTGILTALNYPNLVEKLVVIDMNPVETSPSVDNMPGTARAMATVNFQGLQTLSEAKEHANDALASLIKSSTLRKFLVANVGEESPGNFKWMLNLPVLIKHIPRYVMTFPALVPHLRIKPFEKPTLFISSVQSRWVREEHIDEIKTLFPNAEFSFVDDAGHWLHLQRPDEFLKISAEFINK